MVAEARSWLGTPYVHQGRVKGAGVDCAGLVICVGHALGLTEFDADGYARLPDGWRLMALCEAHMDRIGVDEIAPGDVVLLRWRRYPQHVAIVGDASASSAQARGLSAGPREALTLIHAYDAVPGMPRGAGRARARIGQRGRVVEHALDAEWRARVIRAYRIRGLAAREPWTKPKVVEVPAPARADDHGPKRG